MQPEAGSNWFIYALGGGLGHLNRALALARAAIRLGVRCSVVTNSEHIDLVLGSQTWADEYSRFVDLIRVPATTDPIALGAFVRASINAAAPGVFIVDTFPRGIIGELVDILPSLGRQKCVHIARDLNSEYVTKYKIVSFVTENYSVSIDPGEHQSSLLAKTSRRTELWVTRSSNELRDFRLTKHELKLSENDQLILVSCTGDLQEQGAFMDMLGPLRDSFPNTAIAAMLPKPPNSEIPFCTILDWPGIDYIAAASLVIGAAGYNLVADCRAVGTPLIALPQKKMYDRQDLRANQFAFQVPRSFDEVHDAVRKALTLPSHKQLLPSYINGADTAASLILHNATAAT